MNDTGCSLESLAMRSFEAATGTRTTTQACSISTTIGLTTRTTLSASADPSLNHLDVGTPTEGSILVESIPQVSAKARNGLIQPKAKPKTAAVPTGAVVECGNMDKLPQGGDVIKTNNAGCNWTVKEIYQRDEGGFGFVVIPHNPLNNPHFGKDNSWLHPYELVNGLCRKLYPHQKGSCGYSMNNGGMNGDGYDYLVIVERAAQGSLF